MSVLIRQEGRRCDARCYNGKSTTKCRCVCGGRNHGGGPDKAVENNRRLFGMEENRSIYKIVQNTPGSTLIIRDVGHNDHRSVTNDAEKVVADLVASGDLPPGRRLFYYDSEGQLDELLVRDGKFAGFRPGPRATAG